MQGHECNFWDEQGILKFRRNCGMETGKDNIWETDPDFWPLKTKKKHPSQDTKNADMTLI